MSDTNLAGLLWRTAAAGPERPAVLTRIRSTSFGELQQRAAAVAHTLVSRGLAPGDRAAILLDRSTDAIAALFGIHAAGLVAVPINERLRARQLEYQLAHCAARVLLTNAELLQRLHRAPAVDIEIVELGDVPAGADAEPLPRQPADLAQIIYTSGSTGLPKGVVFTHGALRAGAATVNAYLGQRADDRVASLLALSTVYGLNQVLTAVACGAALVVETSPLVGEVITTLRDRNATVIAAVPPLWMQLLASTRVDADALPAVRILQNAGGSLPVDAVRRLRAAFPGAEIFLQYGQTETFRGTALPPSEVDRRPNSMGLPIPGAELMVVRDDGSAAAAGEMGELVHAGPTIAAGYWQDPESTQRVFRPHPLPARAARGERAVYSGDLVRRDEEGYFYWVSRKDRLIKTMGFRVGPDEIADVLLASGEALEAVVTSEPDAERGERVIAYVVLRESGDAGRLRRYCRAELPPYMVPTRIDVVADLPRLPSGKYDLATITTTRPDDAAPR